MNGGYTIYLCVAAVLCFLKKGKNFRKFPKFGGNFQEIFPFLKERFIISFLNYRKCLYICIQGACKYT